MSYGLNQPLVLGRLGAAPEQLKTKNGNLFLKAVIAVSVRQKNSEGADEDRTSFLPVTIFGKTAEVFLKYVAKGDLVLIIGRLDSNNGKAPTAKENSRATSLPKLSSSFPTGAAPGRKRIRGALMLAESNSKSRPSKSLGKSTDLQPVIVIDTREQEPLTFSRFRTVTAALQTGDYSILGLESMFAVERKSLPDLVACCCAGNRERFERELHRLRGFRIKRQLVVGTEEALAAGCYRSAIALKAVMASLGAWEARFDLPVVFSPTPEAAAAQIEHWAHWVNREYLVIAERLSTATKEAA
jgi:single-strand DNA-binding protein